MFSLALRDLLERPSYRYGAPMDPFENYYITPPHVHLHMVRPRRQQSVDSSSQDGKSDSNKFQVMLNVKHFTPDEIDVKTVDNFVVIHGKHEEQADEHGFVSREFTRRYQLPDDVELDKVSSSLSKDGVLTIQAPRKVVDPPKNERVIPITIQPPAAVEEAQKIEQQQQQQQLQASGDDQTK